MLYKKDILAIVLISLISIGLISYFTISHVHSLRNLNELANEKSNYEPPIFYDLNDEKTMEAIIRKIRHYESIVKDPMKHLGPPGPMELEKEGANLRSLESANYFENVKLIDPNRDGYYYIMRWISQTSKQFSSNIILYPYSFDYTYINEQNTSTTRHFSQGSFLSLNSSEVTNIGLQTSGTFTTKKARAIFNSDFAILSIEYIRDYNNIDAFQDIADWNTYFGNYYLKGTQPDFKTFLETKAKDPSKTYITKIDEKDVIDGNLLNDGVPRFGFLIIPDYILGTDSIIISKLTEQGIKNIVDFYNKGGKIIVNGKSGTLLEDFGLMEKEFYNKNKLLSINNVNRLVHTTGCEDTFNKAYKENSNDFEKQVICLSMTSSKQITLASSFKSEPVKKDPSYTTMMSLDSNNEFLVITDTDNGMTFNLTGQEKEYNPLVLFKKNSKNGNIFVLNFNPVMEGSDRNLILNIIALALSKELYMTSNVNMNIDVDPDLKNNLPIPAGEFGFQLEINTLIHNLNDKGMDNAKLYLFLKENLAWASTPTNCENKAYSSNDIPADIRQRKTIDNNNNYLVCNLNTISSYQRLNFKVKITVLNSQATQLKYQVLLIEEFLSYTDSNKQTNLLFDQIKTNCEAAPLIRGSLNPDPSSIYPFPGTGYYVDNVLKIENKEQSMAYDVEYYGLIPLISPLVDGNDQRKTQWSLKIYKDYYNNNDFEVPLTADDAQDFIYPAELKGKGVRIVAEWDSPVLPNKEKYKRGDGVLGESVDDILGINIGSETIESTSDVIRQVNYRKSDRFYKLASQRLMAFLDTSTPEGAKSYYNGDIPEDILDPVFGDRTKKDLLYTRLDIYFYNNSNYCNPPGISEKHVISIDKYIPYEEKANCSHIRGERSSNILRHGFFNNFDPEKRKIIHQPNIYSNALFELCDLTVFDPDKDEISKYFDPEHFKLIHYIIPNVEKDIIRPKQLYNFVENDEYHGYHEQYPSIKFIYLHSLTYVLDSKYCKNGGRITININPYDISSTNDVTIAPDQIAIYKVEYKDHEISIYFKRGLMSNEQFGKNLALNINIENLESKKNESFKMTVEEMKFDISKPPDFEVYTQVLSKELTFEYISAFSYPAIEMKTSLNRTLNGYETIEPFSRYGAYTQELHHRTVYAYAEAHNEKDPGVTGSGDGFSFISNLGISSIPFIEYMFVGKGQVIPAGPTTSRVSWKDVWGRTWQQPLRSIFPDIPPVPPPLKNFMMTTTYEIIRNDKDQIYEWPSDENVKIHIQVKLLNNYPKYFEITRCKENEIRFVPFNIIESHLREFANTSKENLTESELNGNNMFLRQGGMASYGVCFAKEGAYVSGKKVEGELLEQIERARLCADLTNASLIAKCEEELKDITTVSKASTDWDEDKDGKWNYSPLVEAYYPKGYIEPDMWQLTHVDYDDNAMDKAYKYHVDNPLPNYDSFRDKPRNSIAIPIYKGLGYNIVYDKNVNFQYHGKIKHGWWSDNLQNKDDTLIAGMDKCNKISVNKNSELVWVDGKDLVGSKREGSDKAVKNIIAYRQKNIYTCLFNRKRPQYIPNNGKSYYSANVVENNIVPIIVDLDKDDKRLTDYDCKEEQYNENNIYTLDGNYLATPTSKDYLYFAANLRGHAKETINVVMKLEKFEQIVYEGAVKVNEGGRFVYWNPVNGPNSFLVVDDPVSIVNAKRNDLIIINNIFPRSVATFNSIIYHSYTIRDDNKVNKVWPHMDYYANSHGYGDVTVSVNVGGIKKTKPTLQPGKSTYAKIIFYNNCGFDWNMKRDAITFNYTGSKRLSANDYLYNIVHAIRLPIKYNFMNYSVDKEYEKFIHIGPSHHNANVPPEFFDFENINVVTIRDGFKGEYNLQINVTSDFPDRLRGKPIEIKIELNKEYFDHFPGEESDPIQSYHKYNVTIPSIYIAVPYKEGEFADKVLYVSAQATNVNVSLRLGVDWKIDGIKFVDNTFLEEMGKATQEQSYEEKLEKLWDKVKNQKDIKHEENNLNVNLKTITISGIKDEYEFFPKKNKDKPDVTEISILVRSSVSQLAYGYVWPISSLYVTYYDWINKYKYKLGSAPYVVARGAWFTMTYSRVLVDYLGKGNYVEKPDQQLSPDESGTMKVQFKIQNSGNGNSYDTKYEIIIEPNLTFVDYNTGTNKLYVEKNKLGQTVLTFDYGAPIMAGELKGGIIYLNYTKICDNYDSLTDEEKKKLPKELPVANQSAVHMRLTNSSKADVITQHLRQSLTFAYTIKKKTAVYIDMVVSGKRSDPTITIKPKINFYGNDTKKNIEIYIGKLDLTNYYRDIRNLQQVEDNSMNYETIYPKGNYTNGKKDKPIQKEKGNKNHVVVYTVVAYAEDGSVYHNVIKYEQKKIHISTGEAVMIILSLIFLSVAAFFFWRGYINYKQLNYGKIEKEVKNSKIQKLLND